jgi:hypothetical protein
VTAEPASFELFRSAERSAVHLEMRDGYVLDDPDWLDWQAGNHFDPAERWRDFHNLIAATVARGVEVRRARIMSEPVTDYIKFEYDVTADHNIAAGEKVRWLPRQLTSGLTVPPNDFWVFDEKVVIWNHFAGDDSWVGEERSDDLDLAKLCVASFDAVWDRAIPHEEYQPTDPEGIPYAYPTTVLQRAEG